MTQAGQVRERGRRASVDRATDTVHGSGSGAGGGDGREDYDSDAAAGGAEIPADVDEEARHPLPRSAEARHDQIPEREEREKGFGEDSEAMVQPKAVAVDPDGRPYPSGPSDR
jgi:hypothetical protein